MTFCMLSPHLFSSSAFWRLRQEAKANGDVLYRRINDYICEHDCGDEHDWRLQHKPVVRAMQAEADADLAGRFQRSVSCH
jgi:hypothetical protein